MRKLNPAGIGRFFSSFAAKGHGIIGHPPLNEPFPGINNPQTMVAPVAGNKTEISTLPNGLKVATVDRSGGMCSVGAVVNTGARYESDHQKGVSHFLEKISFGCTKKYGSKDGVIEALQSYGGMYESQHFRDVAVYTVSCFKSGVDIATEVLAETLFNARILDEEMQEARESIAYELQTFSMVADQEPIVTDLVHKAAYHQNTVGHAKICPVMTLPTIERSDVISYYKAHYVPSRMVLVGVGIDHDVLVNAAKKHFPQVTSKDESDTTRALYSGGHVFRNDTSVPPVIGPQELPTLTHVSIGFESSSHQAEDYVKYCVLNTLMGGGGSFSAGGPGKGMYTRLYLQVLNRYHWMYSALAFNHVYDDTGIFTITGSSHPSHSWDLVQVLIKQFKEMATSGIEFGELNRAKTQLKSTLLMNLEYRNIELEDIGRQVLAAGDRKSAEELCTMIDAVTPQDLQRISRLMLEKQPSVGAFGDLKHIPTYEEICAAFKRNTGELEGRISHFLLRSVRGKNA